ncbi:HET-domain-containing protein [Polyporus arcularius HHB13444]|uniref:HET-domain-containing protein n=1 Tax=Polyporus arcularius HHB13444 TaxID=1314778 RepID=A0A5C3P9Y0_9APHY|nr:HET-domain-containing protein [Polyporus arcularius HHB13444]
MWLLSTARAELHFFPTVERARQAGYAILSHVWDEHEQSFQDTAALRAQCADTGSNPRDFSSPKVQAACMLAERHGFSWLWIDTCCIDKMSSAELSEAINAMYAYYAHAAVCYAYLRDVRRTDVNVNDLTFDRSRWFTRGWTLQELVAPEEVVFLSREWEVVGTKADLAALVAWITGIPAPVLRLEERIWDRSVAQRMSWAARRETTRPEDEAYCLMGLFSVNMPVLYGEGRNAFLRLQEEIMRVHADATLFAWGDVAEPVDLAKQNLQQQKTIDNPDGYLLAPSPRLYSRASNVVFAPGRAQEIIDRLVRESGVGSIESQQALERPSAAPATSSSHHTTFAVTPYGVLAHLPVLELVSRNHTVAVLPVLYEYADRCSVLGLPLSHWHSFSDDAVHDSTLPLYFCCPLRLASASGRLWELGGAAAAADGTNSLVTCQWKHIYLADRPPPTALRTCQLSDRRMSAPFRLKQTLVEELEKKGFRLSLPAGLEAPWDGDPPVSLGVYGVDDPAVNFAVHLGRCAMSAVPGTGAHWAYVTELQRGSLPYSGLRVDDHDCLDDHIPGVREDEDEDDGDGATRTFELCDSGLSVVQITLTFVPWALSSSTYVVDIDVERRYLLSVEALNHELFARADEREASPISWSDRLSDDASIWNWTDPDEAAFAIGPQLSQETDDQEGDDVSETGPREGDAAEPYENEAGEPDEEDVGESPEDDAGEPHEDDAEQDKLVLERGSEQAMQESSRRRKFWDSLTTRFKTVRVSFYGQNGRS